MKVCIECEHFIRLSRNGRRLDCCKAMPQPDPVRGKLNFMPCTQVLRLKFNYVDDGKYCRYWTARKPRWWEVWKKAAVVGEKSAV